MSEVGSTARQRVLLVDDDPLLLDVLTTVLNLEELDVVPVSDGRSALRLAMESHIDLVVCDVTMPDPDGLEVCRQLKGDPSTAALPVILLTGRDTEADRERGVSAGCDAYVTKPFSPLQLLDIIRGQVPRRRRDRA